MRETYVSGVELFYRRLLDLSGPEDLPRVLGGAGGVLDILARLTGAEVAYLEVVGGDRELRVGYAGFGVGSDADASADAVQARISREIVRSALSHIEEITTASAVDDERFAGFDSVARNHIRAVACVPIGPIAGALYLQGDVAFSASALDHARRCARHVGEQVLQRSGRDDRLLLHDAMRLFQRRHVLAALVRTDWNVSRAARDLGIARSNLYKLLAALGLQEQVTNARPWSRPR